MVIIKFSLIHVLYSYRSSCNYRMLFWTIWPHLKCLILLIATLQLITHLGTIFFKWHSVSSICSNSHVWYFCCQSTERCRPKKSVKKRGQNSKILLLVLNYTQLTNVESWGQWLCRHPQKEQSHLVDSEEGSTKLPDLFTVNYSLKTRTPHVLQYFTRPVIWNNCSSLFFLPSLSSCPIGLFFKLKPNTWNKTFSYPISRKRGILKRGKLIHWCVWADSVLVC